MPRILLIIPLILLVALPARANAPVHLPARHASDVGPNRPNNAVFRLPHVIAPQLLDPLNPEDFQTIHDGGPTAQCIDIVLMGDGYVLLERDQFFADAQQLASRFFELSPYAEYASFFNIHALFVASEQSGASHPSQGIQVTNAFGTTFDYDGVERLAVADDVKVLKAAHAAMADFDYAMVLVNDTQYGGSGGVAPVVSLHPESVSIARHELAHSLAKLADEYPDAYPGYPAGDPEPNVALAAHLNPLKWSAWVEDGTPIPTPDDITTSAYTPVGAYEGARYQEKGVYRPAPQCIMRALDSEFCPVCAEAMVLAFHRKTSLLRVALPEDATVACMIGNCPIFHVETAPIGTAQIQWLRGDQVLGTGPSWTPGPLDAGEYELRLEVRDATTKVRHDPKNVLLEQHAWQLTVQGGPDAADSDVADSGAADSDVADSAATISANPVAAQGGCSASPSAGSAWPWLLLLAVERKRRRT